MTDTSKMLLLRLIFLFLLSGTSGMKDTHVFGVCGEDVILPYNGTLSDCNATEWYYNRHGGQSSFTQLRKGNMDNGVGRGSLTSDCSLNINKITEEDYGIYTSLIRNKNKAYAYVFLHVLCVSPLSTHTEIRPSSSLTLICHLYTYDNFCCDKFVEMEKIELIWVNRAGILLKTDSRYQIKSLGQFSSILTTTLLNEDNNTEWTCHVIKGNAVKASASFTIKYIVIIILGEIAAFTAPTVILLQIFCERRADNRRKAKTPRKYNDTNT
ncbi:uncharacterized protein LOC130417483 [Triplophysa dalaica]|uniref:uncharacterized protein LOC130417483 n=1 Tax=Triplophysa dalaica TaxID=1582913 RepID=UPI0024DFE735|nr:uncharacterized protein LOC130417483 [Triplophysa dalaica]